MDDRPVHPRSGLRHALERLAGTGGAIAVATYKVAAVAKFFSFFISVAAFAFWFHNWSFALGFVLMIFVHEMGHNLAARAYGLKVSWPTFIPFLGAYVTIEKAGMSPWRNAVISLAGPGLGGAGAAVVWAASSARGSELLLVLANMGFLLNAFNLLPVGILDGGQTLHAAREAWRMPVIQFEGGVPVNAFAPDRSRAVLILCMYVTLASVLVIAMLATRLNGAL